MRLDHLPDLRKGDPDAPLHLSQLPAPGNPSADLFDKVQRSLSAATTEAVPVIKDLALALVEHLMSEAASE